MIVLLKYVNEIFMCPEYTDNNKNDYSDQEKINLECQKLCKEIEVLKRSVFHQPGTWLPIISLLISVVLNFQQCNSRQNEKTLADIKLARTEDDIKTASYKRDSLIKEIDDAKNRLQLAMLNLNKLNDSAEQARGRLTALIASTPGLNTKTKEILSQANQSLEQISDASAIAVADLGNSSLSFKINRIGDKNLAQKNEQEGFNYLMKENYPAAIRAFTQSENALNRYHNSYELSRLLQKNENKMITDTLYKKEMLKTILKTYSNFAPSEVKDWLKNETEK